MDPVDIIESESRELIRRRGVEASAQQLEPLIREIVEDYEERAASGAVRSLADADHAIAEVAARIGGFGPLQEFLDDDSIEEIWSNGPS